jgi:hypothetical protein
MVWKKECFYDNILATDVTLHTYRGVLERSRLRAFVVERMDNGACSYCVQLRTNGDTLERRGEGYDKLKTARMQCVRKIQELLDIERGMRCHRD